MAKAAEAAASTFRSDEDLDVEVTVRKYGPNRGGIAT